MSKDLYDIVADRVIEFCRKTCYYDCLIKFEISYDEKEWDTVTCVVECDVRGHIVFQWDFCEGQNYIRNFKICHTSEAEPVVRCKDCKWYREGKYFAPTKFCFRLKDEKGEEIGYNFASDDFCSYGERKDEVGE